jgi:hypothetical protein
MNDYDLSYLAAKDTLVVNNGSNVLYWTDEQWNDRVDRWAAYYRQDMTHMREVYNG